MCWGVVLGFGGQGFRVLKIWASGVLEFGAGFRSFRVCGVSQYVRLVSKLWEIYVTHLTDRRAQGFQERLPVATHLLSS